MERRGEPSRQDGLRNELAAALISTAASSAAFQGEEEETD